jgi:hypothetical protein
MLAGRRFNAGCRGSRVPKAFVSIQAFSAKSARTHMYAKFYGVLRGRVFNGVRDLGCARPPVAIACRRHGTHKHPGNQPPADPVQARFAHASGPRNLSGHASLLMCSDHGLWDYTFLCKRRYVVLLIGHDHVQRHCAITGAPSPFPLR